LCKSFAVLGMVILFCPQRMRIRITVFQSHYELREQFIMRLENRGV
jgi:hypothetical protein